MDSGKLPGAKKGANGITPPSGAYWAAKLLERKRAEKTLEDRYGQLRERVEEQEAQLSALNDALRRASPRPRPPWRVGRGAKEDASGGMSPNGAEKLPVELLRLDVGKIQQHLEQQAEALQALRADLQALGDAQRGAIDDLGRQQAALTEAVGVDGGTRIDRDALRVQVAAELEACLEADLDGRIEVTVGRILERSLAGHVATHLAADREELDTLRASVASERQERVGLESRLAELKRESAARTQDDMALQQTQAELQRRVADHTAVLRSVSSVMDRELAARREDQAQRTERQERGQRDVTDLAKQVRVLSVALDQEIADRKGEDAKFERALAKVDQQVTELATLVPVLEHEIVARKSSTAALERLREQIDGRVAECTRELRTVSTRVAQATVERERLQEGLADAERHTVEHDTRLRAVTGSLEEEITRRDGVTSALRGLEAWRVECGGRATADAPPSGVGDAPCRDVAIRPAGTLTILEGASDAGESAPGRHDIQVAVNGIIGLTELGLDTELTTAQRQYLERVRSLAEEALTSPASSGEMAATSDGHEPEAFRLREHLRDTLKPLLLRGRQKGLKFSCQIAPRVPDQVFGHPGDLRQVIINLVGNAIKFTESGEISVCIDTASQSSSVAALMVSVVDTGGGIPLDRQGAVLDALMRTLPESAIRGLGLPIAAELVRLMEGRLWFESDEDLGTTFRFTARLGLQEAPRRSWWRLGGNGSRRRRRASAQRDRRVVLIADGSSGDRGALKDMLESEGATAVTVADGRGVLAALEHDRFDLLLMDLRMPGMDAFEAAATIRALEGSGARGVPIIAIGAQFSALDERRCEVVGIEHCLAKPVQARRLLAIVDDLFRAPGADVETDG
jgi:CheY-like chemotaxis protein